MKVVASSKVGRGHFVGVEWIPREIAGNQKGVENGIFTLAERGT